MTYSHLENCINYITTVDPTSCTCESLWTIEDEIQGLEKIQEYLFELFERTPEPTLFEWASIVNGFEEGDYDDVDEVEPDKHP